MDNPIQRIKLLCVDFDGVLHSYMTPWTSHDVISDPPVPGAMRWLVEMEFTEGYQVVIYSSRSRYPNGIIAMREWMAKHIEEAKMGEHAHLRTLSNLQYMSEKPPAYLTIDDRAICFRGTFPTVKEMDDFKPWFDKYGDKS